MSELPTIRFRPLALEDLDLMYRWLSAPHVRQWWDDARLPDEVRAKYEARIGGHDATRSFTIRLDERPIGYIQSYRMADYPDYNRHIGAPSDCAGVDLFIGEPELIGCGIGTRVLLSFLRSIVFADPAIASCAIGPEPANRRAIRAYEKAGFHHWKTVAVPGEPQPEYVMLITRRDLKSRSSIPVCGQ